jgi:NAD(P)-dependent dehydrogenase (short-subunit alcohol dehydrogenase family)
MKSCLVGCMYTVKLALHYFARQPEGLHDRCLVLMSSIAGYCEQPGTPVYVASKHGIRGLMLSLRRTLPTKGARVNLLAPWFVFQLNNVGALTIQVCPLARNSPSKPRSSLLQGCSMGRGRRCSTGNAAYRCR